MVFFFSWITIFSIIFQLLGLELFDDEYDGFNMFSTYWVYTYRNGIGDSNPPRTTFWLNEYNKNDNLLGLLMMTAIWSFWFLN